MIHRQGIVWSWPRGSPTDEMKSQKRKPRIATIPTYFLIRLQVLVSAIFPIERKFLLSLCPWQSSIEQEILWVNSKSKYQVVSGETDEEIVGKQGEFSDLPWMDT